MKKRAIFLIVLLWLVLSSNCWAIETLDTTTQIIPTDIEFMPVDLIYDFSLSEVINPVPANGTVRVSIDTALTWETLCIEEFPEPPIPIPPIPIPPLPPWPPWPWPWSALEQGAPVQLNVTANQCGDCEITYDVFFGTENPPMELIAGNINEPVCDPGLLECDTTYYWQVTAKECSDEITGPIWQFKTQTYSELVDQVINEKLGLIESIDGKIAKEQKVYDILEGMLASKDYGDLKKGDIVTAKQKVHSAIQHEEQSIDALEKSIAKLEDALAAIGWEPPVIDPNLVAHWKLDEISGTTASDSAGSNPGTLQGNPVWMAGKIGGAIDFDGSGDTVVGLSSPFDFEDTTFTVATWFKTTSIHQVMVSEGGYSGGWSLGDGAGGYEGSIEVWLKQVGSTNNAYYAITQNTYNDGNWHHVTAVITTDTSGPAGNSAQIYVDGELVTISETRSYGYGSSDDNWSIGARQGGMRDYFNGSIDDVRIYDKALTAEGVQQLYNAGL